MARQAGKHANQKAGMARKVLSCKPNPDDNLSPPSAAASYWQVFGDSAKHTIVYCCHTDQIRSASTDTQGALALFPPLITSWSSFPHPRSAQLNSAGWATMTTSRRPPSISVCREAPASFLMRCGVTRFLPPPGFPWRWFFGRVTAVMGRIAGRVPSVAELRALPSQNEAKASWEGRRRDRISPRLFETLRCAGDRLPEQASRANLLVLAPQAGRPQVREIASCLTYVLKRI